MLIYLDKFIYEDKILKFKHPFYAKIKKKESFINLKVTE